MLFNSIEFIIFFPVVTLLYFLLPHRFRWLHLLAASCVFYMFFVPIYILILAFTITVDYFAGILIENAQGKNRKFFLVLSLVANIGVLAFFKYYNFFTENLNQATQFLNIEYALPVLSILLPVGLSFHTFQAMSYTIEVYRGRQKAEKHIGIYALYVMFFPQLVAGPIERPQNLLPQFYEIHDFNTERVSNGLKLILWGMFKKVVVADNLAVYVDTVYNNPQAWDGLNLIIAAIFFSFQVYCDFSGYSDIAIGAAEVLGFKLMTNFNRPFHAKSISELWQRWHISLTTWFKDYLYIPLGGNRGSKGSWYFNIMFVFFISGIWHGAAWTYIIWGFLNGFFILFSIWTVTLRKHFTKLIGLTRFPLFHRFVKTLCTVGLFTYSLIFFRANSMLDVLYIHKVIVLAITKPSTISGNSPVSSYQFIVCIGAIVFLELIHYTQSKRDMRESWASKPIWIRWAIYYAFILAIFFFGEFSNRQFVYFQF